MPSRNPVSIDVYSHSRCLTYGLFSDVSLDVIATLPALACVIFRGVGDVGDEATTVFRTAKAACDQLAIALSKASRGIATREIVLIGQRYDVLVEVRAHPPSDTSMPVSLMDRIDGERVAKW